MRKEILRINICTLFLLMASLSVFPQNSTVLLPHKRAAAKSEKKATNIRQNKNYNRREKGKSSSGYTSSGYRVGNAIDLGLSVKWADRNVGATSVYDFGDFFAWGETKPKPDYTSDNYRYANSKTGSHCVNC